MERQKRKLKGIADLYSIEDERQKRQSSSSENVTPQNISSQNTTGENTSETESSSNNISTRNISQQNISLKTVGSLPTPAPVNDTGEISLDNNISHQDISPKNTFHPSELSEDSPSRVEKYKADLDKSIPSQDVSQQNIFGQDTLKQDISLQNKSGQPTTNTWSSDLVDPGRGYFPLYNDVTDRLIREMTLDVYEQSVLLKLYRDSRGWKSDVCEISHAEIVRSCNISKSQSQRTLAKLSAKGLIVNLGRSKSGPERNRFKVLPGVPIVPQKNISREDISREEADVPPENKVSGRDISQANTNKNNNKDLVNTHTQPNVGVGSKFSLEECKRYAEHLQKTGQGINNPGGFAMAIFRSGLADGEISGFLNPAAAAPPIDMSTCPDCGGTGAYYPEGYDKGVARCRHEKLKAGPVRLRQSEIEEQARVIGELLEGGYTIEEAETQLAPAVHPEDWEKIKGVLAPGA